MKSAIKVKNFMLNDLKLELDNKCFGINVYKTLLYFISRKYRIKLLYDFKIIEFLNQNGLSIRNTNSRTLPNFTFFDPEGNLFLAYKTVYSYTIEKSGSHICEIKISIQDHIFTNYGGK